MPLYEYTCEACAEKFEHLQRSMTATSKPKCPKCGSPKTARALSVFAVGSESTKSIPAPQGGCGRCGGPGPCAMGE